MYDSKHDQRAVKNHALFKGPGPILTALSVEPAEAPAQEVATF